METTHTDKNGNIRYKVIYYGDFGTYAEVYAEDDDGNGLVGYWYGSVVDCQALDPFSIPLGRMPRAPQIDPFDLACERRFD